MVVTAPLLEGWSMAWNPGSAPLPAAPRFHIIGSPEDESTRPIPILACRASRPPPGAQRPPWCPNRPVRGRTPYWVSPWFEFLAAARSSRWPIVFLGQRRAA